MMENIPLPTYKCVLRIVRLVPAVKCRDHRKDIEDKCDVIKQNQSEVGNIDFKIEPNKEENVFVSYCFWHPSTAHIFGTN